MIGVINYQTGNSQSVIYALDHLGLPARLVNTPHEAAGTDRLILPGVGSAGVTMRSLQSAGWVGYLNDQVMGNRSLFLGICVGMQVLFDHSEEEDVECLGWLPGTVQSFTPHGVRVPQIGWNSVRSASSHPFVADLPADQYFYFVNSFYAMPSRPEDVAGITEYGVEFASIVARGNVMATQFHTEKSGPVGLRLLNDFATLRALSELES